jgi:hypothetical protein
MRSSTPARDRRLPRSLHPQKAAVSSLVLHSMLRSDATGGEGTDGGYCFGDAAIAAGPRRVGRIVERCQLPEEASHARASARCRRRRRSPATLPGFHAGRPPQNKGMRYPAGPAERGGDRRGLARRRRQPARPAPASPDRRTWRAESRISEALALAEADLDQRRGAVLVRRGKGGRRREVGMDDWPGSSFSPG